MSAASEESLRVYIGGDEYSIRSDVDPATIKRVADYLDRKVMETQRTITSRDKLKVAVLSALNITGELLESRSRIDALEHQLDEFRHKAVSLGQKIDSNL